METGGCSSCGHVSACGGQDGRRPPGHPLLTVPSKRAWRRCGLRRSAGGGPVGQRRARLPFPAIAMLLAALAAASTAAMALRHPGAMGASSGALILAHRPPGIARLMPAPPRADPHAFLTHFHPGVSSRLTRRPRRSHPRHRFHQEMARQMRPRHPGTYQGWTVEKILDPFVLTRNARPRSRSSATRTT